MLFEEVATHVDVGHGSDPGQLEVVFRSIQIGTGGEDVRVIVEDVSEDLVVVIVWDEPIDLPRDGAERQLPQAHVGDKLLPGVDVVGDGLLVGEANDEGLRPQGRRLVAGGEPASQQVGLEPENLVGEVGEASVDADRFLGDQERVEVTPDRGGQGCSEPASRPAPRRSCAIRAPATAMVSLPPVLIT